MKFAWGTRAVLIPLAVLLVGAAALYWLFGRSGSAPQTITVHPKEFLQQVSVSGKVVAAQNVALGFSQGGRIASVHGAVGDTVTAGSVLAEIENGDIRALVLQKQAALVSQRAKLQALKNGTRPEDIAVAQASVDGAVSGLAQANQAVVNAMLDAYAKSDDAIHNKVDLFINNPNTPGLSLMFSSVDSQAAVTLLSERASINDTLAAWQATNNTLTASGDVLGAAAKGQAYLAQVATLLANAGATLSQGVASQSVSQALLQQYAGNIATARTTINTSIAALNTAVTAQKSAAASLDSARKNLALLQAGATQTDIDAQAAQVAVAEADVQNAEAQLDKTRILAPFTGVLTSVDAKIGQTASANAPQVSMIGAGVFQIESYIPEINVSLVKSGDPASVTLDAYGAGVVFDATVVSIDPAETIQNGVSTYRAVLQFAKQDARIKSGMTANVVITAQKREGVISIPQGLVIKTSGAATVKVQRGQTTEMVPVQTGDVSSSGEVEIRSGLQDGDVVVVAP